MLHGQEFWGRMDEAASTAAPEDVAAAIRRAAEAGAVGASIEDYDVERIAAAAEAAHQLDFPFILTARAENQIRRQPDLAGTIARLQAFEAAGADVLYAPGLRTAAEVRAVCAAVSKPVNVLAQPELSLTAIVEAGAQRISVGGRLAWTAVNALIVAATAIRDRGDFSAPRPSAPPLRDWFASPQSG